MWRVDAAAAAAAAEVFCHLVVKVMSYNNFHNWTIKHCLPVFYDYNLIRFLHPCLLIYIYSKNFEFFNFVLGISCIF